MEEISVVKIISRKRQAYFWIFNIAIAIMSYGFALVTNSIGVDDECLNKYLSGGLIQQGRFGLNITNSFFSVNTYLPFFYLFIALLLMILGNYVLTNLLYYISNGKFDEKCSIIFSISLLSFPNFAYLFIFTMTQVQTGLEFLFVPFAVYFAYKFVMCDGKLKNFIYSVLIICFILYSNEAVIISIMLISLYLMLLMCYNRKIMLKELVLYVIKYLSIFIFALVLWKVGQIIVFNIFNIEPTNYVNNYFKYTKNNFIDAFKNIFVKLWMFCKSNMWTSIFRLTIIVGLLALSKKLCFTNKTMVPMIISLIMIIGAFSLVLITGNFSYPKRANIYLAPFFAICLCSLYLYIKETKRQIIILSFNALIILLVYYQAQMCNIVFYSDYLKCNLDYQKVYSIAEKIQSTTDSYKYKPVIFIGRPESYNLLVDDLGIDSIFRHDRSIEKKFRNDRIYNFFSHLGFNYQEGNQELYSKYINFTNNIEFYPKNGYVKETDDAIIVKLGEVTTINKISNDELRYSKENLPTKNSYSKFNIANNDLQIKGWAYIEKIPSYNVKKNFILTNSNTKEKFIINTSNVIRKDVTKHFNNIANYDECGYDVDIDISNLPKGNYNVELFLEINDELHNTNFKNSFVIK